MGGAGLQWMGGACHGRSPISHHSQLTIWSPVNLNEGVLHGDSNNSLKCWFCDFSVQRAPLRWRSISCSWYGCTACYGVYVCVCVFVFVCENTETDCSWRHCVWPIPGNMACMPQQRIHQLNAWKHCQNVAMQIEIVMPPKTSRRLNIGGCFTCVLHGLMWHGVHHWNVIPNITPTDIVT